jgi:hypothetical protein
MVRRGVCKTFNNTVDYNDATRTEQLKTGAD